MIFANLEPAMDGTCVTNRTQITHTVSVWEYNNSIFCELLDVVDFMNEFSARTYCDAVNMGIYV